MGTWDRWTERQIDRGGQRDKKGTEGGRDRDILKMPQRPTQGSAIFEDPVGHLGTPGEGRGDSRSHDDPKEKDSQAHGNAGTKQDRIPRVSALLIGPQGQARLPVDWGGRGGQPRPPSHHPPLASRPPSPPAHSEGLDPSHLPMWVGPASPALDPPFIRSSSLVSLAPFQALGRLP